MGILLAAAVMLSAAPLFAISHYQGRPNDPKAVYLTPENFPVNADGVGDDSPAIQQAIDKVRETSGQGIVFVPSGRYRLTKTIYIWPGIRLIGFGAARPTFVLGAKTPGFQQGPAYMVFFAGGRPAPNATPPDANPGTFYSAMSNIDVSDESEEKTYVGSAGADGTISNLRLFAEQGGESVAVDEKGDVYIAAGQVYVYDSGGKLVDRIDVPERPSQLLFGGSHRSTLFILARSSLYGVRTRYKGR